MWGAVAEFHKFVVQFASEQPEKCSVVVNQLNKLGSRDAEARLHLAWLREDVVRWHHQLGAQQALAELAASDARGSTKVNNHDDVARIRELEAEAEYAAKAALKAASIAEDERHAHAQILGAYQEVVL